MLRLALAVLLPASSASAACSTASLTKLYWGTATPKPYASFCMTDAQVPLWMGDGTQGFSTDRLFSGRLTVQGSLEGVFKAVRGRYEKLVPRESIRVANAAPAWMRVMDMPLPVSMHALAGEGAPLESLRLSIAAMVADGNPGVVNVVFAVYLP